MNSRLENYINGSFVAASGSAELEVVNPVTGERVAVSPISDAADVEAAFTAARTAFASWRSATPSERQRCLLALADKLEQHSEELVEAQHRNTGQPRRIIAEEEVAVGADQLRFFAGLHGCSAAARPPSTWRVTPPMCGASRLASSRRSLHGTSR